MYLSSFPVVQNRSVILEDLCVFLPTLLIERGDGDAVGVSSRGTENTCILVL